MIVLDVGASTVSFARLCVDAEVRGGRVDVPEVPGFSDSRGVFVTLNMFPSGDLRGCIGYPYPVMPLGMAVHDSAVSACHDPRFLDLSGKEADAVTVEVTLLTVPETIVHDGPEDLLNRVRIGTDGLILECSGHRGLLLPQVPVEWGWDVREFLKHLSTKAGLPQNAWMRDDARIMSFRGEVYSEETPRGNIVRKDI